MIWYFIEAGLIVVAASCPALKPFFLLYLPALICSGRDSHKGSTLHATREGYDLQRPGTFISISTGPRARHGDGDHVGHIADEEWGIIKTTEVFLTVEHIPELQSGGNRPQRSPAPWQFPQLGFQVGDFLYPSSGFFFYTLESFCSLI